MNGFLVEHEAALRLATFAVVLAAMIGWELAAPRRRPTAPLGARWTANLGLVVLGALAVRLLLPAAAVGSALVAESRGWGLLPALAVPPWAAFVLAFLALDLAIWAQHVAMHKVPPLWRLHRVHHTDVDYDTTTGVRFHPVEILASMLYKMAVVVALGAPAAAVVTFEVILSATSLFNHGNVRLPIGVDRVLRRAIVTPDMHRVHHSVYRDETDSNYGFNLSVWDRLFGTYRPQPRDGHENMAIGQPLFRTAAEGRLGRLLWQPLRRG
jgi:sterol desaturase/sphingolipid hydroxylase (fatty acid hydroxylase superfamily)